MDGIDAGLYFLSIDYNDPPPLTAPEEIRTQFNLPMDVPIVPVVAKDKKGVFEAFELLVEKITG